MNVAQTITDFLKCQFPYRDLVLWKHTFVMSMLKSCDSTGFQLETQIPQLLKVARVLGIHRTSSVTGVQ